MLKLKPVTKENLIEIADLEMEDDQKGKGMECRRLRPAAKLLRRNSRVSAV